MADLLFNTLSTVNQSIGEIILNRPKALNAINLGMIQAMHVQLKQWENDPTIKGVLVRSNSEKAFCAGGDIRAVYDARGQANQMGFFEQEYKLDSYIHHYPKPYLSLIDGICMGGGAGISVNGKIRIATEKLKFAMPETGIGFFPDVGAASFLNRCPGKIGYYLGLTGHVIGIDDAMALGLMTHHIRHGQIEQLMQALQDTPWVTLAELETLLATLQQPSNPSPLLQQAQQIDDHFSQPLQEIVAHYPELNQKSPSSLAMTLTHLKHCKPLTLDEILEQDLKLAKHCLQQHDFYEGVRAALVDKDKNPQWEPASLDKLKATL